MKADGGPAFPMAVDCSAGSRTEYQIGMSLRDYFAAHAPPEYLAAIVTALQEHDPNQEAGEAMAAAAFMYADNMLAARDKT